MTKCGILLHISSLPSPYGIGTLGKAAYDFVDFLAAAKHKFWQVLPVGPTGFGDSPYLPLSAYAGNPYFIDLDMLYQQGLLPDKSYQTHYSHGVADVDYANLYATRFKILRAAYENRGTETSYGAFCQSGGAWLDDYALFSALHDKLQCPWDRWDEDIKRRDPETVARYREELSDEIGFHKFIQYLFDRQFAALRVYAARQGVALIGDIPIYAAYDSADVWGRPELFQLDADLKPKAVAGVPPDAFSADGQLWGNPLYDWESMERDGFRWWIDRIRRAAERFDAVRIDHFRGFESYFSVPYGMGAKDGEWKKGPDRKLFTALKEAAPGVRIIAEDLGDITPEVAELLRFTGFPGMRVLQFAFDGGRDNPHRPENYTANCVVYTGTHDNPPTAAWYKALPSAKKLAVRNAGGILQNPVSGLIRRAFESRADTVIIPIQDYLRLGGEARMNEPSTAGNWRWRLRPGQLTHKLALQLAALAYKYNRA